MYLGNAIGNGELLPDLAARLAAEGLRRIPLAIFVGIDGTQPLLAFITILGPTIAVGHPALLDQVFGKCLVDGGILVTYTFQSRTASDCRLRVCE